MVQPRSNYGPLLFLPCLLTFYGSGVAVGQDAGGAEQYWLSSSLAVEYLSEETGASPSLHAWMEEHGALRTVPDVRGAFIYYRHERLAVWCGPYTSSAELTSHLARFRRLTNSLRAMNPDRYRTARAVRFEAESPDAIARLVEDDPDAMELRWLLENLERLERIELALVESGDREAPGAPLPREAESISDRASDLDALLTEESMAATGRSDDEIARALFGDDGGLGPREGMQLRTDMAKAALSAVDPDLGYRLQQSSGMMPSEAHASSVALRQAAFRMGLDRATAESIVQPLEALASKGGPIGAWERERAFRQAGQRLMEGLSSDAGIDSGAGSRASLSTTELQAISGMMRRLGPVGETVAETVGPARERARSRAAAGSINGNGITGRESQPNMTTGVAGLDSISSFAAGAALAHAPSRSQVDRFRDAAALFRQSTSVAPGSGERSASNAMAPTMVDSPTAAAAFRGAAGPGAARGQPSAAEVEVMTSNLNIARRVAAGANAAREYARRRGVDVNDAVRYGVSGPAASAFQESVARAIEDQVLDSLAQDSGVSVSKLRNPESLTTTERSAVQAAMAEAGLTVSISRTSGDSPVGLEISASISDAALSMAENLVQRVKQGSASSGQASGESDSRGDRTNSRDGQATQIGGSGRNHSRRESAAAARSGEQVGSGPATSSNGPQREASSGATNGEQAGGDGGRRAGGSEVGDSETGSVSGGQRGGGGSPGGGGREGLTGSSGGTGGQAGGAQSAAGPATLTPSQVRAVLGALAGMSPQRMLGRGGQQQQRSTNGQSEVNEGDDSKRGEQRVLRGRR